MHDNN
jgi:hypothetical protein